MAGSELGVGGNGSASIKASSGCSYSVVTEVEPAYDEGGLATKSIVSVFGGKTDLPGGPINDPLSENTFLLRCSQQLPCVCWLFLTDAAPFKGPGLASSTAFGTTEKLGHR